MHIRYGFSRMLAVLVLVGGALATAVPLNSYGDPPPWAPAHGKRKKGDAYTGYTGKKWDKHYGVVNGRCNREAVGAVIGAKIGRDIDQTDRACIGHALELAGDNKRVTWSSADNRTTYLLTPVRGFEQKGVNCREFDLRVTSGERKETSRAKGCPGGDGTWRLVG